MDKSIKILQICLLIVLLIILFGILMWGLNKNNFTFGSETKQVKNETISLENIDQINFNTKSSDVQVYVSNTKELRIVQYSAKKAKEKDLFTYKKEGSTLTIEDNHNYFCIGFCFNVDTRYEIYLPKTYTKNLNINEISGDITIEELDLSLNSLSLKTTSGDIEINNNVTANNLTIDTKSGEIKTNNIKSNKTDIQSISGDLYLESLVSKDIYLHTISGEVEVNKIEGKLEIKTTSGDIEIDHFSIRNNSKITSISGDVDLNLSKDSHCNVIESSVSGDKHLPHNSSLVGKGTYKLEINTTSGDIEVNN